MAQRARNSFLSYLSHPQDSYEVVTRNAIAILTEQSPVPTENAWDVLEALAGGVEAPEDWSIEHDHYLYGTPI